jgi:hypothetical protein
MSLRSSLSEIKRWALPWAARPLPKQAGLRIVRLQGETLELRTLFAADIATPSFDGGNQTAVAEPPAIVLHARSESGQDGVVIESFGADQAVVSDPAPPPGTTSEGVLLEKPFLSGTLVVSRQMASRVSFEFFQNGQLSGLHFSGGAVFYGYADTPNVLTIYATPKGEGGARVEIESDTGIFREYAYSGNSNSFLNVRNTVFTPISTKNAYLIGRRGMAEQFDLTKSEPRLVQRTTPLVDFSEPTRIEHYAQDGSSLVYELPQRGAQARVQFSQGGQQLEFVGEPLLQSGRSKLSYDTIKVAHINATGVKEFVSLALSPETIVSSTLLEDAIIGSQPFGVGRFEVYQHRTLSNSSVELRARVVAPNAVPGEPERTLVFPQIQSQFTNAEGALVIRHSSSSKTFWPSGQVDVLNTSGTTYSKQISQLRIAADRISLELMREERGTLLGDSEQLQQSRLLFNANGELWEIYVRQERGDTQLIWARPLSSLQPGVIAYWSPSGSQVIKLVSIETPEFDEHLVLRRLKGVERYEDDLRQINVEAVFENGELQVSLASAPRPLDIRIAFGDGELIAERRSDGQSYLYLFDAAGRTLLEQRVVYFKNGGAGIEVDDGASSYVVHSDGRITRTSTEWTRRGILISEETRRFIARGSGHELLATERLWRLANQTVQRETLAYSETGELLSTRISRDPSELIETEESPGATFELTLSATGASTLFLYQSRTGELRNSTARRILFADAPELVRGANGLINVVRGYEKSLADGDQFVELDVSAGQTRFSEHVVFETFFGDALDNRLGVASVLLTVDRHGDRRMLLRLSGPPLLAERSNWHPFDLFLAAQPLLEYEIVAWRSVGARLIATRADGAELALWADEQSPLLNEVRGQDTAWGRLTTTTTYRPLYGIGPGSELTLAPIAHEVRDAAGRLWQSERVVYQTIVIGEPKALSRQIEWRLADGRRVEYRQQGDAHVLKITTPTAPHAAKIFRFLEAPVLTRQSGTGLATSLSGKVAGPLQDELLVLPLF